MILKPLRIISILPPHLNIASMRSSSNAIVVLNVNTLLSRGGGLNRQPLNENGHFNDKLQERRNYQLCSYIYILTEHYHNK